MIEFDSSLPITKLNRLPQEAGIYFLCDADGNVLYVGKSINIHNRWRNHHKKQKVSEVNGLRIAWKHVGIDELDELEAHYIKLLNPEWNLRAEGGAIQTRAIRLSDRQVSALESLFERLGIQGQRGTRLNAGIRWLADTSSAALAETAAALEIAAGCAAGDDWHELIEAIEPDWPKE